MLTDLPSTVSVGEDKKLSHFVVLSVFDALDEATGITQPVAVSGESERQIRCRVFEGEYVASPDTAPLEPAANDNGSSPPTAGNQQATEDGVTSPKNTQWYFVLERDTTIIQQQEAEERVAPGASADQTNEEEAPAGPESTTEEPPEERLNEVVVENLKGMAHFQRLALPATTLPGSYHILCESVSSTDSLPLVIINLSVG